MSISDECFEYLQRGDLERAIDCFNQVIEIDPSNATAFFSRGSAKCDLGFYESAFLDFDQAIELAPNHAWAFYSRGVAKSNLYRYESALSDFDRAIELDPDHAPFFLKRGDAKYELFLYESALLDYDRTIELAPNNATAFASRGNVKISLRRHESALFDFDRAVELNPNYAWAFYRRGVVKFFLHHYESALPDYDRAIKLNPNYAQFFFSRGNVKSKLHRYESALLDFDRAVELGLNHALAFDNRGGCKFSLSYYESALLDYDRAIELDPELSFPYAGKAKTFWIGYDNLGAAHLHFNRFIFLAKTEEIIEYWEVIHDFYSQHTAAPFLFRRLFGLLPGVGDFVSLQGILHTTERQCRTLKNYLQHLRDNGEPERDATQFYRLEALVHYFMGDPIEAYRIYDDIIDGEQECLDLMDSYYFLCSASEFLEPCEGIRHFALQQANQLLDSFPVEGDERERYYAGQLFALGDDWEKAFEAFGQAQAFFPAAVMQAVTATRLDKPHAEVEELWEIARQITITLAQSAKINGFPEVRLELGREDYLVPFREYAHYREIAEYLHFFRDGNVPFQDSDFWEIWQLSHADKQEIEWQLRKKELERIEAELQSFFTQNLAKQYADYTKEQLINLKKVLGEKDAVVQGIFKKLRKAAASGSKALEHQLGLEINHWELHSAHAYALMLKYFFLSGKLADKPALLLYFYNDFIASQNQRDYAAAKEAYVEGSQPIFSLLVNTLLKLGDVASAVAAGALSVLTQQFFNQNKERLDENDPLSNYQKFKAAFLKFLSFEMESLGKDKFLIKYPLEGWEDWKK